MTCPCDGAELATVETALSVLQAKEQAIRNGSASPLPPLCSIEPYRQGATDQQKRCHAVENMLMVARWILCAAQPDPAECFDGYCDYFHDRVDACYAT